MCSEVFNGCLQDHKPLLAVIESSHYLTEQTWQDLHLDSVLGEPLQVKSF